MYSFLAGYILNSYFMAWPKEYILFCARLPIGLSGGHAMLELGVSSFISDITSSTQRTFRF